jgi:CBS domain-containing protein
MQDVADAELCFRIRGMLFRYLGTVTMNLGEIFRSDVVTVGAHDTIRDAMEKMKTENVGSVVVVQDREVVGILTDRDVALTTVLDAATADSTVEQVMTKDVLTIWEEEGVFNATQYFIDNGVRRLPVVDLDNRLVGMLTSDDLFALLARELFNVSQCLRPALAD